MTELELRERVEDWLKRTGEKVRRGIFTELHVVAEKGRDDKPRFRLSRVEKET